jgi:hypothetical protein
MGDVAGGVSVVVTAIVVLVVSMAPSTAQAAINNRATHPSDLMTSRLRAVV